MVDPDMGGPSRAGRPPAPQLGVFAGEEEEPVGPVNWNTLPAAEAAARWVALEAWVSWLRTAYGLSVLEIPPLWHRHDELVWELSALHQHWLACYGEGASGSAPLQWHRDFDDARHRLRRWVAACGTQGGADRPTLVASWPGQPPRDVEPARAITDRDADFQDMVRADVQERLDAAEAMATALSSPGRSGGA
ncbi:hypothetical protein [Cellulomonas aerilata]|uniref:Uncharacterized protein n=1 Tax=Cellulomonas aerilata TaxID=515326 RepID=A0A512DD09_9CELL|nr:hypothetical protein [Cellulomonas aerilata]GEO34359.1 hypothetical protein CAE01nite_20840 [Cellulomonas aerilata]